MAKRDEKPTANLPATFLEAEAKAFAWAWLARARDKPFFDSPHRHLDPATSHWWQRKIIKRFVNEPPLNAAKMVEAAVHGWPEAQDALIELIAEKTARGEPLGAVLGAYNIRL